MAINKKQIKEFLENHRFEDLFIEELGWDESKRAYPLDVNDTRYELLPVARKRGFVALHCPSIPDAATRAKIENKVSKDIREHLIIFTDSEARKQRWQWVRRIPGQPLSRKEHEYLPHQPMLLIERIGYLEVPVDEEDHVDLLDMFEKVKTAFNIDKVTKKFFERFKKEHDAFLKFIDGIADMGDAQWYASVMLNRLMFIYFIQKKGFLDGDTDYLRNRLARVQELKGKGKFHTFYRYFMLSLCHEVLAKKERSLDKDLAALIGNVPYLNGGIFQPHELEIKYGDEIGISDDAFEKMFNFFDQYEWHLDNRPNAPENEINPDVLGYIFEKYINQKQMSAYYTKEDITEYISKNTIIPRLFDKAQKACKIAFEGETSVWSLLKEDPDRYIYTSVRHGATYDIHNDVELDNRVPYPSEIEMGLDTTEGNLLERRKQWNTQTPAAAGLPTEIWRETVARRQRYSEVKGKLESGEVQSINDMITLNLNIRQFAQDVIERCESPDLLNAFWVAIAGRMPQHSNEEIKPGITVLDPTCGSGAFLFAALNILEPLYEACLERMKGFLEEWGDHPKHRNYASFFKSIREDIGKHPSPKYFIYKSIIIHNLYGVDIMKEAVEICKLRLFLKLVAQVEDGNRIEPLPDIDFNIRSGNTLIGFATEDEMKRAMQGDLLAYATVLPEILEQAEECDRLFNLFREAQLEGDGSLGNAKAKLSGKLDELNGQLNQYLAFDYGVDPAKPKQYGAFLESHQPFHWFVEFYGIIKTGGFDAIIGNPPWKEYSTVKKTYRVRGYDTESSGNLYGLCSERSATMLSPHGFLSFIVQLPIVSSSRMRSLRDLLLEYGTFVTTMTCDDRPGKLFDGLQHCRSTIFILQCRSSSEQTRLWSSGYRRWATDVRRNLFPLTTYSDAGDDQVRQNQFPKLASSLQVSAYEKVFQRGNSQLALMTSDRPSNNFGFYQESAQYWVKATVGLPYYSKNGKVGAPAHGRYLYFKDTQTTRIACAILNSSLFYTYFVAYGDCFHVSNALATSIPVPPAAFDDELLAHLGENLMQDLQRNAEKKTINTKDGSLIAYDEFRVGASKPIIDEIDRVLAEHYGFTEDELDYIINYDIKYRMGKDLLEGEK
jgi:hypothetical protein